jgi:excinuclease UvrABC nuclease subunit
MYEVTGPNTGPAWVYKFYDRGGILIYVGATENIMRRLRDHKYTTWIEEVGFFSYRQFEWHGAARAEELAVIEKFQPKYNKTNQQGGFGNSRRVGDLP